MKNLIIIMGCALVALSFTYSLDMDVFEQSMLQIGLMMIFLTMVR